MINWLTQSYEWVSTALPAWADVLTNIISYSWVDLLYDVFLDPQHPLLGFFLPQPIADVIQYFVSNVLEGSALDMPIVSWILMASSGIMLVYLAVSFVKWIIGIIT